MTAYHGAEFLVFVAATFLLWCIVHRWNALGKVLLLAASCIWYAGAGLHAFMVLVAVVAVASGAGLAMGSREVRGHAWRRSVCVAAVLLEVVALAWFKYGAPTVGGWLPRLAGEGSPLRMAMPLGMSFIVFQSIAYVVDVYRGSVAPVRSPVDMGMLTAFFPKVAVGPLVRSREFLSQCATVRRVSAGNVAQGVEMFAVGLFKKACLADTLGVFVDGVFAAPGSHSSLECILAVLSYAFQIYYDFSGCIDMVRGIAVLFDYALPENFNQPYVSLSITEFWRRWHMTLSTWLRDYVFLPTAYVAAARLGRERYLGLKAENIVYALAAMTTMLVCGAWHGAGWMFVAWGAYHGLWLVVERFVWQRSTAPTWKPSPREAWTHWAVTMLAIGVGWLLFRVRSLDDLAAFAAACARITWSVSMSATCCAVLVISSLHAVLRVWWRVWPRPASPWSPGMQGVLAFFRGAASVALLIYAMVFSCKTMVPYIYAQF